MHVEGMVHNESSRSRRQPIGRCSNARGLVTGFAVICMAGFGSQPAAAFMPTSFSPLPGAIGSSPLASRAPSRLFGLNDVRLRNGDLGNFRLRTPKRKEVAMSGEGLSRLASASSAIAAVPLLAWEGYQQIMRVYPLEMDALTGVLLYIIGKWTSNQITKSSCDSKVYGKWGIMGALDGWFTHIWYMYIDVATMFLAATPALKLFTMTVCTSFLYTPIYCVMFLSVMGALEGKNAKGIVADVTSRCGEMTSLTIKTWMPLNVILFGLVPAQFRVLVSMMMNYVYLIGLAMWESGRLGALFGKQEVVQAGVDYEPINPSPTPGALNNGNNENVIPTFAVDIAQPIFAYENTQTPWDQNVMATALRTDEGGIIADGPMMHSGTVETLDHAAASPAQPLADTSNML